MQRGEHRDAIDACLKEAGQPPVDWRKDGTQYWSDGSTELVWLNHAPFSKLDGSEALAQWHAWYRQALIICGIVAVDHYDGKPNCPVGRLQSGAD